MRDRYKYPHADRDAMPGEELTFYVTDRECGIRGDPGMCMLAQSAMRAFDTDQVWFGRRVAMVQVGAEVLRYNYDDRTQQAVRHYDATGEMAPGVYKIVPPKPGSTLKAKRERGLGTYTGTHPQRGNRDGVWCPPRGWGKQSSLQRLPDGVD
jgi:hypothetical protein